MMQLNRIAFYILLVLPIVLASSTTLLFVTYPFSYVLFLLFLLLSLNVTLTVLDREFTLTLRLDISNTTPYFLFIIASTILVLIQITNVYMEIINVILYLAVFVLAFGSSLLAIFGFKPKYSRIELLAIAYPMSLALLATLGTFTLFVPTSVRGPILSILITFLTITAFAVKRRERQIKNETFHEITINNCTLTLLITLIILTFVYIVLYPEITHLLGLDIVRNFMSALAFTKEPLGGFFRIESLYPLFGVYQSSIIYVVKPSPETFQIIAVSLNIFAILTFYAMAGQYLKKYGNHTPAIATLIWSLFSGLGWLNFLRNKILNPDASMLTLIGQADVFSYGDITWRRLFFYLSMEATLTLTFAVLYLLKRNDIPEKKHVILTLLLIMPIPLMHEYATYFLLPTLLCFALICRTELGMQLKSTGIALVITSFTYVLFSLILNAKGLNVTANIITFLEYLISGLFLIMITYSKRSSMPAVSLSDEKVVRWKKFGSVIITFLLVLYFACILLWYSGDMPFVFSDLNRFGYVPSFLYPVKLGLIGILAIASVYLLIKEPKYCTKELLAILASAILLITLSRLIATLQMQYTLTFTFNPSSWLTETLRKNLLAFREERMFEIFKIPLAIIASLTLGFFFTSKIKIKSGTKNHLITSGIVSIILISGISSTLLGFTYYREQIQANTLSPSELSILQKLQSEVYANGKAIIIAPQTPTSYLDFTGATAIVTESMAAWSSKSPELPLFVTRYSKTTPTYIYLHKLRDYQKLSEFFGNYLEHLSNTAHTYFENQEVQIEAINNWSIPTPQSSTALIIPYDKETMTFSQPLHQEAYKQYTVLTLFFDPKEQFMNVYQEPITYNLVEVANETAIFNGSNSYIRINGTNANFDKILIEFDFEPLDTSRNQVIVSKFDWGQPSQKSWEIAQYGKRLAFKISADGTTEVVLLTTEILAQNKNYRVRCEYDGEHMKIFINNNLEASKQFKGEIFKSDVDLLIGGELYNSKPVALAKMGLKYIRILNEVPPEITGQIFYAYDVLSSAGLNYTTVLSIDSNLGNYKTIILPYDDISTYEILSKIENGISETNTRYVVVLNTNGYGPFLNLFGKLTNRTFVARSINVSNKYSPTSFPLVVQIITLNSNAQAIAYYTNNISSSPMVMKTVQNQTTLLYINLYPLIEKDIPVTSAIFRILTDEMDSFIELYDEKSITKWFTEPSLLFSQLYANGTIKINSDSIHLISIQGNQTSYYVNDKIATVECRELYVGGGYGFYSTVTTRDPTLTFQSNSNAINIKGNVTFLIRQPRISLNGSVQFKNFYMLHPPIIYTDGRTTSLSGNMTLEIYTSDKYTISLPYKFNAPITVRYEKPLMEFDETIPFIKAIPTLLIVIILLLSFLFIYPQHQPASNISLGNKNEHS